MGLKENQKKQDDINLLQMYMQLYDKQVLSKKTLLENFGFDSEKEKENIKKEKEE